MSFLRLDNYTVPGFGLQAALSLKFKDEDASGDSSSTAKASKGTKGKSLECKVCIRFRDEADLRSLTSMAEAKQGGDGRVYTITNRTANAAGMRQGRFTGDFRADEQEDTRCWLVSFSLAEHISVPERAEAREAPRAVATQQNPGETIAPAAEPTAQDKQNLTWAERMLKKASDAIGGFDDAGGTTP